MAFSIRELEALSGIKAHTIRIWEQRYNFLKPSRTQTNIRTYNNDELKTLLTVALLNKYGYKISHIDEMDPQERINQLLQLPDKNAFRENLVNQLIGYMIDLNCSDFESLLNEYLQENGIENTIEELIFQFLERVGILWQTSKIIPIQEHIVSNIIRQKIISAIEHAKTNNNKTKTFLLLLPEDEHHEMGLLYVYYLLKKYGFTVIYLGASVPLIDIQYINQKKKPDFLYLHITSFPYQNNLGKYLNTLHTVSNGTRVILSGSAISTYKKSLPPNFIQIPSISELVAFIGNLD
jgi:hypothetical protein